MRRREFISLLGGAAVAWPLGARAEKAEGVRRIGVLTGSAEDAEWSARFAAFKQRLGELGWIDGRNLRIDIRATSDNVDKWRAYARELVASAPDLILVNSNPGVAALQRETRSIPIVFTLVGDPVGSGFVASLARPGGNVTGFMHFEPAMGGKWVEVLKEAAPLTRRALVIQLPESSGNVEFLHAAKAAGPTIGIAVSKAGVHDADEIERAVTSFALESDGGLVVLPNPVSGRNRDLIAKLAIRPRLPTVAAFSYMVASGGLISYGIDAVEVYRRGAGYVDRVLRGEKPADLPVQAPTKFELIINLKTAKALGLEIPPTLLARADEVIE
jgi:putative tryptophan/tyrosine transport system substrate-binding protein